VAKFGLLMILLDSIVGFSEIGALLELQLMTHSWLDNLGLQQMETWVRGLDLFV